MRLKTTLLFLSFCLCCFIACQSEITEVIQPSQNEVLQANSTVATLVQRTATKDGSKDNIIDNASCISVRLPVNVVVNGTEIVVNVEEDYNSIEAIFDASTDDDDSLQIVFPIVIILNDFSEITIYNYDDLNSYSADCNGNNEQDDDIECVDFIYPIYLSVFNTDSQSTQTVTIENDEHFYKAVKDIEETQIIEIQFPISVILYDGTEKIINNMVTLQNVIEEADGKCNEDDNNDYNDDDCIDCNEDQISQLLVTCSWNLHKLINSGVENTEQYGNYKFTFLENGTVVADDSDGTNFEGTWSAYNYNFRTIVDINFNDFSNLSFNWILYEVDDDNEIYLKFEENEMEFEKECN